MKDRKKERKKERTEGKKESKNRRKERKKVYVAAQVENGPQSSILSRICMS